MKTGEIVFYGKMSLWVTVIQKDLKGDENKGKIFTEI